MKILIEEVVNEAVDYVKCPYECEVNVTIVTNERIHEINNEFRGIDKETDVLSFPMIDYDKPGDFTGFDEIDDYFDLDTGELILGDIVISYDQCNEVRHMNLIIQLEENLLFLLPIVCFICLDMTIWRKMKGWKWKESKMIF